MPRIFFAMMVLTLVTALETPSPPKSLPPSRSSKASAEPVEAPDGTPKVPWPVPASTITSTVRLPRESRICLAKIFLIGIFDIILRLQKTGLRFHKNVWQNLHLSAFSANNKPRQIFQ